MKYLILILSFCLVCLSCENDLELLEKSNEIPVVYGLINSAKPDQYVRIERAFSDPNTSADKLSLDPNQLYFSNITVNVTANGNTYNLTEVDAVSEGFNMLDGTFANTPNKLWKFTPSANDLKQGTVYNLNISGINELDPVNAEIKLIKPPFFSSPQSGGKLSIRKDKNWGLTWSPQEGNEVFSVLLTTHITENDNGNLTNKDLTWVVRKNTKSRNLGNIKGNDYLKFLSNSLQPKSGLTRSIDKLTLQLFTGDEIVEKYINVASANTGVTASGEIPVFTNIEKGRGIFASTNTITKTDLILTGDSYNDIKNDELTKALNFK